MSTVRWSAVCNSGLTKGFVEVFGLPAACVVTNVKVHGRDGDVQVSLSVVPRCVAPQLMMGNVPRTDRDNPRRFAMNIEKPRECEIERWENEGGSCLHHTAEVVSDFVLYHQPKFMTNSARRESPEHPCKQKGEPHEQARASTTPI